PMSSKYINGTYASGYTLTGAYFAVTIGTLGSIDGSGLVGGTNGSYAITNLGRIAASTTAAAGVLLQRGGTVVNGSTTAWIAGGASVRYGGSGGSGIVLIGIGSIGNAGTITGGRAGPNAFGGEGIYLSFGGSVGNSGTVIAGGDAYPLGAIGINLPRGGSI